MEERLITELIEFVQAASPVVWAAATGQVSVLIFQAVSWLVVLSIMAVACVGTAIYAKGKKQDYDDWGFVIVISIALGLIAVFGAIGSANEIVSMNMNPDYYALEALMRLVQ